LFSSFFIFVVPFLPSSLFFSPTLFFSSFILTSSLICKFRPYVSSFFLIFLSYSFPFVVYLRILPFSVSLLLSVVTGVEISVYIQNNKGFGHRYTSYT
jgi:hypothetical protein